MLCSSIVGVVLAIMSDENVDSILTATPSLCACACTWIEKW